MIFRFPINKSARSTEVLHSRKKKRIFPKNFLLNRLSFIDLIRFWLTREIWTHNITLGKFQFLILGLIRLSTPPWRTNQTNISAYHRNHWWYRKTMLAKTSSIKIGYNDLEALFWKFSCLFTYWTKRPKKTQNLQFWKPPEGNK